MLFGIDAIDAFYGNREHAFSRLAIQPFAVRTRDETPDAHADSLAGAKDGSTNWITSAANTFSANFVPTTGYDPRGSADGFLE
jgi:hypothetical protein